MMQNIQNGRRHFLFVLCLLVFLSLCGGKRAYAAQEEDAEKPSGGLSLEGQDLTEGFRYGWGENGGFSTNILQNGTEDFAYFSFDEGISWHMFRDGGLVDYKNMDLLTEAGDYVLYLTGEKTGENAVFAFRLTGLDIEDLVPSQTVPGDVASLDWLQGLGNITVKNCGLCLFFDEERKSLLYRDDVEYRDILRTDVPNNAVTGGVVYFEPADGVSAILYRDGEPVEEARDFLYAEPGYYRCRLTSFPGDGTDGVLQDGQARELTILGTEFRFRILDGQGAGINVMSPPDGFFLESVSCNGACLPVSETGVVFLSEDGSYEFCFRASEYAFLTYGVSVVRDTTAPFLLFDKEIGEGAVKPPVRFSCTEEGCTYQIRRNGYAYTYRSGDPLFTEGYYRIFVSDARGNTREYTVRIEPAYQFFSKGMLWLLAGAALLVVIAMLRIRHDVRVR